ncbi:MAG: hypothetical protein ACREON_05535, partial [Gemmatimonadaceae bacterium]
MIERSPQVLRQSQAAAPHKGRENGAHPFVAMAAAFGRALEQRGDACVESHYAFGGRHARLRVIGHELARELVRPLAHLHIATNGTVPTPTALAIDLWDGSETGEPVPRPHGASGDWTSWPAGDGYFFASADGRFVCYDTESAVTWLDRRTARIVGWRAAGEWLSVHERT